MTDEPRACTGADDPRERCGRHHPLAILDGRTCCCDAAWLLTKKTCFSGAAEGAPVAIEAKLEAMLGYTVADTPQDVRAHVEGVMDILAQGATVPADYRQRIEDLDKRTRTVEAASVVVSKRAADAEAEIARLRAGEADEPAPDGTWSTPPQWIRHWNMMPANVRLAMADQILRNAQAAHDCAMAHGLRARLDAHRSDEVTVRRADLDLVMNHAGDPATVTDYPAAAQRIQDALGGQRG